MKKLVEKLDIKNSTAIKSYNNEPSALFEFFDQLLVIDKRINPENYKNAGHSNTPNS